MLLYQVIMCPFPPQKGAPATGHAFVLAILHSNRGYSHPLSKFLEISMKPCSHTGGETTGHRGASGHFENSQDGQVLETQVSQSGQSFAS